MGGLEDFFKDNEHTTLDKGTFKGKSLLVPDCSYSTPIDFQLRPRGRKSMTKNSQLFAHKIRLTLWGPALTTCSVTHPHLKKKGRKSSTAVMSELTGWWKWGQPHKGLAVVQLSPREALDRALWGWWWTASHLWDFMSFGGFRKCRPLQEPEVERMGWILSTSGSTPGDSQN